MRRSMQRRVRLGTVAPVVLAIALLFVASCGTDESSAPPTVVLNAPAGPLAATDSFQFNATVNGVAGTAVFWSLPEGAVAGTITPAGLFTAGTTPGTYQVVATTPTDPAGADTALVTVTLHIAIIGPDGPMGPGMARQFFAAVIGTPSKVLWTLPAGATAGSLDSTGLYTAGATPGTYQIVATTEALPASADTISITVLPDPATPTINAHADSLDPNGADPTFSVVPVAGLTYSWSPYGGHPLTRTDSTGIRIDLAENSPTLILQVTAMNAAGRTASAVDTVTIIKRLVALPGGSFGVAISAQNVLAAFRWEADLVDLRSGSDTTLLHSVASPGIPVHGGFSGNGSALFVVNQNGLSVGRIDVASGAIVTSYYGRTLFNIAVAPDSTGLYVGTADGWLIKGNPTTLAAFDSVAISGGSSSLALRAGQLWVGTFAGRLYKVDPVTLDLLDSLIVPGAEFQRMALNADASRLYAADQAHDQLVVVNTATKGVSTLALGATPNGVALTPDGSELWIGGLDGRIQRRSAPGLALLGRITTGGSVRNIAFSADGTLVLVGHETGTTLIRR